MVEDPDVPDPLEEPMREVLAKQLDSCLERLDGREQYVLRAYADEARLWEIAETLGVTESRVSQILTHVRERLSLDPRVRALAT
jgi:RNA polymerase sigma factor (sigma-70 family)